MAVLFHRYIRYRPTCHARFAQSRSTQDLTLVRFSTDVSLAEQGWLQRARKMQMQSRDPTCRLKSQMSL
jgi:hypothetical protein